MCDWIVEKRQAELVVSTVSIISKALSLQPSFKDNNPKTLKSWVFTFLSRFHLSCRMATRTGQSLNGHLPIVKQEYTENFMKKFSSSGEYSNISPQCFVNTDETALYFEANPRKAVHFKGDNKISIRSSKSNNRRITVCISVASCKTRLQLFFIFKGQENCGIEKELNQ